MISAISSFHFHNHAFLANFFKAIKPQGHKAIRPKAALLDDPTVLATGIFHVFATKKAKSDHVYRPHQRTGHAQYHFSLLPSGKDLENPCITIKAKSDHVHRPHQRTGHAQ